MNLSSRKTFLSLGIVLSLALILSVSTADAKCIKPKISLDAWMGPQGSKVTVTGVGFRVECNDDLAGPPPPAPLQPARKIHITSHHQLPTNPERSFESASTAVEVQTTSPIPAVGLHGSDPTTMIETLLQIPLRSRFYC